jgi:type VI secretion system protein VasG
MEIVPFFPLGPEFLQEIVRLKLSSIGSRLADSHRMKMEVDPRVEEAIASRCTDVDSGARNIDHIIQQTLLPMMATAILEKMAEGPLPDSVHVTLDEAGGFALRFGAGAPVPAGKGA